MPGTTLQSNFTAGELSPSLSTRVQLEKYGNGCRTLRNFLVQSHGPATKRPGFELLDELPGPAALAPFVFNQDQAYCLCFGDKWLRVATHDGFVLAEDDEPYQIESPYTLEQARQLSHAQSADVLFIACHGVRPQKLKRLDHDSWEFEAMTFTAPLDSPAGLSAYFVNGAKNSDGSSSAAQLTMPYTYTVTALNEDGKESALSVGADVTGPASNNWQAGDYIRFTWTAVSGAAEYRVYKSAFGGRPGYVATTGDTAWNDYNTLASLSEGAPAYEDPFPEEDFPGAVCFFEQRLVFASSPNRPQTIWMSKSGDYGNFAVYTPLAADSPIEATIASEEVSPANWLVALRTLILGTRGMEWEIAGRGDGAFAATNMKATPQSYWGSSLKRAMVVGNVILHVSSSGSQVRSLQYEFAADSYNGMDLSIMASHLLENERITDWAYQKNPDSIIWAVRSDGVLLGLTYQAEHQISAWHQHNTQGQFRAVCSVPHGFEHSLFALVERETLSPDGSAQDVRVRRYYLERMAERYHGGDPAGTVFLDSALTYRGEPTKIISGLEHLNGKTVGILADGAVLAPRVVNGGRVELDHPASVVTVGLAYTADLETMPVEVMGNDGSSVALKKQINAVDIIFRDSLGVKAGLSFTTMQDVRWRTNEPYGKPPAPFSGMKQIITNKLAENILTVCVRSDLPTPVTVLALVSRITVNAS